MLSREDINKLEVSNLKRVHFVGIISGFSSFCANYLLERGIEVTASEFVQDSPLAKEWVDRGVLYEGGHSAEYINDDIDLVVFPNGPIPGNPECEKTEELGIPSITVGQMTGIVGRDYKVIAIAGTHGKTTTSALTTWLLHNELGTPNFIIGDNLFGLNKSWNYNPESEYLVIEACEYRRQFLDRAPTPYISVITNIGLDHTDYYKDQEDYNDAFVEFLSNTTEAIVIDSDGKSEFSVLKEVLGKRDIKVVDIKNISVDGIEVDNLYGSHNIENLKRAVGVAEVLGIDNNFKDFPGIASRFEFRGESVNGMKLFLDYAHNPEKIKACLNGAKAQFPDKRIVLVWQPHSFERSYSFKKEFANSIVDASVLYIPNIFSPRRETDEERALISEQEFVDYLSQLNPNIEVKYTRTLENTADILNGERFNDDYIAVFASAGDLKNIFSLIDVK